MEKQLPSIGRIVNYNTTEDERKALKALNCNASKQLPAVIVGVWGETPESACNLKVFVDGPANDLWKTSISVKEADENGNFPEGSWNWPVKK